MKIVLFKDKKGDFRWKMVARNGRIIANSAGDGYKNKQTMLKVVRKILYTIVMSGQEIVDKTDKK